MIGEPVETAYDLRFRLLGVNVRVHPMFWLLCVLFNADFIQEGLFAEFFVCVLCIFVSILVHEMGHVLTGRFFGSHGDIILYGFGGLATGSTRGLQRWQRVLVLLMGPGAEFLLVLATIAVMIGVGFRDMPRLVQIAFIFLIQMNVFWIIVNLLPVWPLDGGQVSGELFSAARPRDGFRIALIVSTVTATAIALIAFAQQINRPFLPFTIPGLGMWMAFLFGMLAYGSYEMLQRIPRDPWREERYERTSWERDPDEWRR